MFEGFQLKIKEFQINHETQATKSSGKQSSYLNGILIFCLSEELDILLKFHSRETRASYTLFRWPRQETVFEPKSIPMGANIMATVSDQLYFLCKKPSGGFEANAPFNLLTLLPESTGGTMLDAKVLNDCIYVLVTNSVQVPGTDAVSARYALKKTEFQLTLLMMSRSEWVPLGSCTCSKIPDHSHIQWKDDKVFFTVIGKGSFALEEKSKKPIPEKAIYSWRQQTEQITIQIKKPLEHARKDLDIELKSRQIRIASRKHSTTLLEGVLYTNIILDESTWTLEEGHIVFTLAKVNESCRWPHLFAQDDNVDQEIDSISLMDINARLERYSSENPVENVGQLLASTETPEFEDFDKPSIYISTFSVTLNGMIELHRQHPTVGYSWLCPVFDNQDLFCLTFDVDGVIFKSNLDELTRVGTFDALSYIKTSKRDASIAMISNDLEYAVIVESKRYLFMYENPKGKPKANQYIIDMWSGDGPISHSLVIGIHLESNAIWIRKEDSIVEIIL
jgi:hypothetical protein